MIWVVLYLLIVMVCTAVLCTGWGGLFVLDDFYVVPILSAAFWPVGLPMCIGFIIAKYLLLRYGERNEISR